MMIKGPTEFFLMKKFPKLTLFGLAVAALVGRWRAAAQEDLEQAHRRAARVAIRYAPLCG
jgi:hypothetical protein